VSWVSAEWRDDDTVVLAMLNALKIGYEQGPAALRAKIGLLAHRAPRGGLTPVLDNDQRADRVMAVFDVPPYDQDDLAGSLQDLLTDLLHLADRKGIDFEHVLTAARNNHAAEADEDSASDTFGDCLVCGHPVLKCAGGETRCGAGFAHDEDCLTEHATQCDECRAMEFYPSRAALVAELREIEAALSPENLSCDGLASPAAARKRKVELTRRYRAVVDQLGGVPPKEELWPELYQA
jgi:hypothetical protein